MPQPSDMERQLNPWDILLGACVIVQMSFIALRLSGVIDGSTFLWGQIFGLGGGALFILRVWNARPDKPRKDTN